MTLRVDSGALLRTIRAGKHTQSSLARELGLNSANAVHLWQHRGIPERWLPKLAQALGVTLDDLQKRLLA